MRVLIVAVLVCVVALGAACGDDDSSSATPSSGASGQYFSQLQTVFADSSQRTDDATAALDDNLATATSLAEDKAAIIQFLDTMIATFNNAIDTMDALNPPSEAEAAHDAFRDDTAEAKDVSEGLRGDIADASSEDDAQAVVQDFNDRVVVLVDHAQGACRDLQSVADEQSAGIDLQCREE